MSNRSSKTSLKGKGFKKGKKEERIEGKLGLSEALSKKKSAKPKPGVGPGGIQGAKRGKMKENVQGRNCKQMRKPRPAIHGRTKERKRGMLRDLQSARVWGS